MPIMHSADFPDFEEIPDSVLDEMLIAGANVAAEEQRKQASALLGEKGYGTGTTAGSIVVKKPRKSRKGGREISITFDGTRPNGTKTRRNAEVAFINEYGKSNQPAKQFIRIANEKAADDVVATQEGIFETWQGT